MTAAQARHLNKLRQEHGIDICHFPILIGVEKRYKFYIQNGSKVVWNSVTKNGEGKIVAYQLFPSFETGLSVALSEAKKLIPKTC